jgi:hypothetical protein
LVQVRGKADGSAGHTIGQTPSRFAGGGEYMNIFSKLALTAGMSLLLAAGVAQAQSKTFNVW